MAHYSQLGLQDALSPVMEELHHFHDHTLMVVFLISTIVLYAITAMVSSKLSDKLLLASQQVEVIWTGLPGMALVLIAMPSLQILYVMDEVDLPQVTIKALGHQWYWSYEYTDYVNSAFDSYMVPTQELTPGQFRLLEVDHRVVVPLQAPLRVLISAEDVLHSWTVPSLGVKMDAVPGRLNQSAFVTPYPGLFYGQCSEICGANHSFMPIVIEAVTLDSFENWMCSACTPNA